MKMSRLFTKNLTLAILFISFNTNAQFACINQTACAKAESLKNPTCTLVSFTAKCVDNKVYLNWVVNGMKEDCVYFIQRSENDKDYVTIGTRNGTGVEPDIDILNCFTDENPLSKKAYYRIATINNLGELHYTPCKIVDVQNNIGVKNNVMFVSTD